LKALILAGGLGTRLRPLTFTRPKHLLPIANRAHIEHVFDLLRRHGVNDVVLLTSYLSEAFAGTVARAANAGLRVHVTQEPEPLGTAGALKNAEAHVRDGTFLAFNGDVLTDVDLSALVAWHQSRDAEATILLTPVDDPSSYGVVPTDSDGRVQGFIEKPPREEASTNLINAGVYVLEPSVLSRIPKGEVVSAERRLFPQMIEQGERVFARGTDAYWMDIGTPEKYLQANLDALAGRFRTAAVHAAGDGAVLSDAGARIDPGARVSSSCVGAGAVVEGDAVVRECVLLPRAVVGRGAHLARVTLGEGATVSPGTRVAGRAIADGHVVES
jgi:mannose-1-phosphate guanylyltransferase